MGNQNEDLYDESEAEEALSFCDLPLDGDWEDLSDSRDFDNRRSSEEELFEFFNDLTSEMCFSEDLIFCGKLLPYSSPSSLSNFSYKTEKITKDQNSDFSTESFFHCKSNSLSESQRSQSNVKDRFIRSSCSLDYRHLKKSTAPAKENDRIRIPAVTSLGKSDFPARKVPVSSSPVKSKWNLFMFGLMKSPTDMKLRDIKKRQSRRNPSSMFPSLDGGEMVSVSKDGGKRSSWGLLRALGFKGHVRASLGCIPHVLT